MEELFRRGLVRQSSSESLYHRTEPLTFYVGFDPTANSLHVGHLLQVITVKRLLQLGHQAIILIGDATARIGDPSGKRDARPMLSVEEIDSNAAAIESQIMRMLVEATAGGRVSFVRNSEWYRGTFYLDFLRDIGTEFSVNVMLRAECFKARLADGLSYLELSYMPMQAYDFLHLHRTRGCTLQVGGDDQWSNILAGTDLIRRKTRHEAYGMTMPLLVNSDGTKMGKTEKGSVWLSKDRTSVFDFFQYWRNIPDDKVIECHRLLLFTEEVKVESVFALNEAKRVLAYEMTRLVHGPEEALKARAQAEALFEAHNASAAETVQVPGGIDILEALKLCGMAKSKNEARNLIINRGVFLDDVAVTDPSLWIKSTAVLRKGKKTFKRLEIIPHG